MILSDPNEMRLIIESSLKPDVEIQSFNNLEMKRKKKC